MSESSTYRIMANRIRMFVRDWSGDNPPVVFLHHITGNSIEAFRLAKTLNGRRRLVAPDLRGRGQSDMPFGEYGIQAHVRELDAFLDRMELDRPYLVGHSYGATLCIFLAAARPDWFSGVVLMDGGALPHPQALQSLNIYYDHISYRYPSLDAYLDRYRQQRLTCPGRTNWRPCCAQICAASLTAPTSVRWPATYWMRIAAPTVLPLGKNFPHSTRKLAARS